MADTARDAYMNHEYRLAADRYARSLTETPGPGVDVYIGYANSLAKCGQIRESMDVYSHCARHVGTVPQEQLRHLASALLETVVGAASAQQRRVTDVSLACAACEGVLHVPVTVDCGHTFCRKCMEKVAVCGQCGQRIGKEAAALETNVTVRELTEKWWGRWVEAARVREEGDELYERNNVEEALVKYNQAIEYAPHDHMALSSRSRALVRLSRLQDALDDADTLVALRPSWGMGHYRRGIALYSIGHYKEALTSLCVSAALSNTSPDTCHDVSRVLYRLLNDACWVARVRCRSPGSTAAPYARCHSVKNRQKQHRYVVPARLPKQYSDNDSEDNDSCEDDASQLLNPHLAPPPLQCNAKLHSLLDAIDLEVNKAVRLAGDIKCGTELPISAQSVDLADYDCVLCCRMLCHPVTTPCGHTYCRACLDRCLDYSSACPLCMTSLETYLSSSQRSATVFLESALTTLMPGAYAARQLTQCQDLTEASNHHVPMFVCTTAFPGVPCPLFVYEPRYRNMVRRCVQASRQFGIVACLSREPGSRRYADYGTLQEIMDCVLMPDGCSIVATVGRRRFKVVSRGERDGYDTAQVEFIKDQPIEPMVLQDLKLLHDRVRKKSCKWFESTNPTMQAEIVRVFGDMPAVEDNWSSNCDGPSWAWWLLAILPLGPRLQVGILSTTVLEKRLRAIEKMLVHIQQNQVKPIEQAENKVPTAQVLDNDDVAVNSNLGSAQVPVP